jgi:hypothetical protein
VEEETIVFDRDDIEFPESALEREFIAKYLFSKGYKMSDLKSLSEQEMRTLMNEACQYAALRLAEIESRSKFRRKIEGPD